MREALFTVFCVVVIYVSGWVTGWMLSPDKIVEVPGPSVYQHPTKGTTLCTDCGYYTSASHGKAGSDEYRCTSCETRRRDANNDDSGFLVLPTWVMSLEKGELSDRARWQRLPQ